jgi:hypothetical protein
MPRATHTEAQLLALKNRLAPALLAHPRVSGVGVSVRGLRVYLAQADADAEAQVRALIQGLDPTVAVECLVSGAFSAQAASHCGKPNP